MPEQPVDIQLESGADDDTPGVFCIAVTPHTPRMGIEDQAPDFLKGVIEGSKQLGGFLRARRPDAIVLQSTHWVCTFNWYATAQTAHRGVCVADEAPDLIPGAPYAYAGDPELAQAIAAESRTAQVPFALNETEHFVWDYGSWVPLHYLDPNAEVPVVLLPACVSADLGECARVGAAVDRAARRLGRRVVYLSSSSFAHKLVRGPDRWPTPERRDLDRELIASMCRGELATIKARLPEYCEEVVAEMGGRTLATMFGCLDETRHRYTGRQFGPYGQSSGSGNASVAMWRDS